jgi:hypothetical protein
MAGTLKVSILLYVYMCVYVYIYIYLFIYISEGNVILGPTQLINYY